SPRCGGKRMRIAWTALSLLLLTAPAIAQDASSSALPSAFSGSAPSSSLEPASSNGAPAPAGLSDADLELAVRAAYAAALDFAAAHDNYFARDGVVEPLRAAIAEALASAYPSVVVPDAAVAGDARHRASRGEQCLRRRAVADRGHRHAALQLHLRSAQERRGRRSGGNRLQQIVQTSALSRFSSPGRTVQYDAVTPQIRPPIRKKWRQWSRSMIAASTASGMNTAMSGISNSRLGEGRNTNRTPR